MMMLRDLARRLPEWDASVKLSLALAIVLLVLMVALGFGGPRETQMPARVGAFGLLVTLQVLFLWANRRDISPYHQAQNHFVAGDYQAARSLLEGIPDSARVSVDALVLLGNCYRHLGLYERSGAALERALQIKPDHHLALFSRGKLCLVRGEYGCAVNLIQKALSAGAPGIVRFELGQARFHAGEYKDATIQLNTVLADILDDPPLALLSQYYLYRMGESQMPSEDLARAGIAQWQDEARKHESTPYGESMRQIVAELDGQLVSRPDAAEVSPAAKS